MYSRETIAKVIAAMKEERARLEQLAMEEIALCISDGNRKIGRVMNVSLAPILTCANCSECMWLCYDVKACAFYTTTVVSARMRNTVMAILHRDEYFERIEDKISRRKKNKYFRWHVAGDILDLDYFKRMVEIAARHPDFVFWTYTKNYSVVNMYCDMYGRESIPSNFSIMFSEWDGLELDNPHDFPVFSCKLKAGNKNHALEYFDGLYKCPGNCDVCKLAGRGCVAGESTYADEH